MTASDFIGTMRQNFEDTFVWTFVLATSTYFLIARLVIIEQPVSHSEAINFYVSSQHAENIKEINTSRVTVVLVGSIVTVKVCVAPMLPIDANAIIASEISRLACWLSKPIKRHSGRFYIRNGFKVKNSFLLAIEKSPKPQSKHSIVELIVFTFVGRKREQKLNSRNKFINNQFRNT